MSRMNIIYNFLEEEANKAVGYIIAILIAALLAFFKKIPFFYRSKANRIRNETIWYNASATYNIIQNLADITGAMYVHVVRYHNKGPHKLTIDAEVTGKSCGNCVTQCHLNRRIERMQHDWQAVPLTSWGVKNALNILNNTATDLTVQDITESERDVFMRYGICTMKQVFIKHKPDGFIVLSVSFCCRFKAINNVNGLISQEARRLEKYL
jgi:hypothetical protein